MSFPLKIGMFGGGTVGGGGSSKEREGRQKTMTGMEAYLSPLRVQVLPYDDFWYSVW